MIVLFLTEVIVNNDLFDRVFLFKGEAKEVNKKIVECNLHLTVQTGSGFDSYVVLNNLPQWRSVPNLIENGAGIVLLKIFNGYFDQQKKSSICSF